MKMYFIDKCTFLRCYLYKTLFLLKTLIPISHASEMNCGRCHGAANLSGQLVHPSLATSCQGATQTFVSLTPAVSDLCCCDLQSCASHAAANWIVSALAQTKSHQFWQSYSWMQAPVQEHQVM